MWSHLVWVAIASIFVDESQSHAKLTDMKVGTEIHAGFRMVNKLPVVKNQLSKKKSSKNA